MHGVEPDLALLVEFDAQIADRRSGLELGGGILIGTAPSIQGPARPPGSARIMVLDAARVNPFASSGQPLAGGLALVVIDHRRCGRCRMAGLPGRSDQGTA